MMVNHDVKRRHAAWQDGVTTRALKSARVRSLDTGGAFVAAVRSLLADSGPDDLTLSAVVARSGHSLRAFYSHFGGKDDLLLAVIEEISRDQAEHALSGISSSAGALDRIAHIVATIHRSSTSTRSHEAVFLSREYLRLIALDPVRIQVASAPLTEVIEHELEVGIEQGAIRVCDPRRTAEMIVNVVASEINSALADMDGREPSTPEDVAAFCCGAVRRFDAPRPEGRTRQARRS
jgi:AcrR family transcriptional regulator